MNRPGVTFSARLCGGTDKALDLATAHARQTDGTIYHRASKPGDERFEVRPCDARVRRMKAVLLVLEAGRAPIEGPEAA